jgi:small subunit ribosomal protein S10
MTKIRLKIQAFDHQLLEKTFDRIAKVVEPTGAIISGPIPLPTKKKIYTVLRSPHVYKDSREQFMQCIYKRIIDIYPPAIQSRTIDVLMTLELPAGVDVSIQA